MFRTGLIYYRTTINQAKCLNDLPSVMAKYDYLKEKIAPGEKVSAIKQCQKAFGRDFFPHVTSKEPFEVITRSARIIMKWEKILSSIIAGPLSRIVVCQQDPRA